MTHPCNFNVFTVCKMESRYVAKIQRWVELDNKIEVKKMRLKEFSDEKKNLEEEILNYIESENKHNVQINTSDGNIQFVETKMPQLLTFKFLRDSLARYFEHPPDQVNSKSILDFIQKNRDIKSKLIMKRQITPSK